MNPLRLADYLGHIRQAATDACDFLNAMDKVDFFEDRRTQQAVIMSIVILGEAVTKIMDGYPDFVKANPQIPWRNMRGMRNRIAHGYFDVNLDVVWDTVKKALPKLLDQLASVQPVQPGTDK